MCIWGMQQCGELRYVAGNVVTSSQLKGYKMPTLKLGIILGLIIGIGVSALCWIAEDSISNRCRLTNENTTVICQINAQNIHFYREVGKR